MGQVCPSHHSYFTFLSQIRSVVQLFPLCLNSYTISMVNLKIHSYLMSLYFLWQSMLAASNSRPSSLRSMHTDKFNE